MPYYAIDWRRYADHSEIRSPLDASASIGERLNLLQKICKLSGFWISYQISRKYRWVFKIHLAVLALFCLIYLILTCIAGRFVNFSARNSHVQCLAIFLYMVQCTVCGAALVFWQSMRTFQIFAQHLQSCSLGIGIMKQRKFLVYCINAVLAVASLWPLICIIYSILHTNFKTLPLPKPWQNESLLFIDQLNPLGHVIFVHMSLCWWLAHCFLIVYLIFALVELHVLNDDLRVDTNLYQVPVLKHYLAIHYRLTSLYGQLSVNFDPVVKIMLATNGLSAFAHCYWLIFERRADESVENVVFSAFVLVFSATYAIICVVFSYLRDRITFFIFEAILFVVSSDRNLYADFYPAVNYYHDAFWSRRKQPSVWRTFIKLILLIGAFTFVLYHQRKFAS